MYLHPTLLGWQSTAHAGPAQQVTLVLPSASIAAENVFRTVFRAMLCPGVNVELPCCLGPAGALASSPTATPASVVLTYLGQPFPELRVAVYRALSALLLRDWMAVAVCSNAELLAFLLNPGSESGRQGCEWRHATVVALAGTIRLVVGTAGAAAPGAAANGLGHYHAVLAAAAQRVDDAVAAGPYGGHRAAPREHLVATIHRGGGGL